MERIGDEEVQRVLHKDQGSHAQLISWNHESLATKSDGNTSGIFNVRVKYEVAGKEREACYAAKLSPTREVQRDDFYNVIFTNECRFYTEVVPAISSVLEEVNEKPISFPKCYYHSTEAGKEVLFLENLKEKGYMMQNKALGLDLAHTSLVLKELGKLHAASVLLQTKLTVDLTGKFDFFKTEWTKKFNLGCDWATFMDQFLDTGLKMFEEMGDCEKVIAWLKRVKPEVWPRYQQMIARKAPFDAVIHGDCWINNMLFRYDEAGHPVDVMFLDLQGTRVASVALDLQHFLNLNVPGKVRRPNFDTLIATYYDSFHHTISAGNVAVPFTLEELKREYVDKGFYGVLYSIMWLPCMMSTEEGALPFEEEKQRQSTVRSLVNTNSLLRPTILSVIEEWIARGIII